jgi:hypothetical protein
LKKSSRTFPSSLQDIEKTIIRIEQDQMTLLGINSSYVVKFTWLKTTVAFYLPLESGFKKPNDSKITYMTKSAILPQARMSDIVSSNVGNQGMGWFKLK